MSLVHLRWIFKMFVYQVYLEVEIEKKSNEKRKNCPEIGEILFSCDVSS